MFGINREYFNNLSNENTGRFPCWPQQKEDCLSNCEAQKPFAVKDYGLHHFSTDTYTHNDSNLLDSNLSLPSLPTVLKRDNFALPVKSHRRSSDLCLPQRSSLMSGFSGESYMRNFSTTPLTPLSALHSNYPETQPLDMAQNRNQSCQMTRTCESLDRSISPMGQGDSRLYWPTTSCNNFLGAKKSFRNRRSSLQLPYSNTFYPYSDAFVPSEVLSGLSCKSPNQYNGFREVDHLSMGSSRPRSYSVYSSADFASLSTSPCGNCFSAKYRRGLVDPASDYLHEPQKSKDVSRRASIMPDWYFPPQQTDMPKDNSLNTYKEQTQKQDKELSNPVIYAVIDSEFEKLCRDIFPTSQCYKTQSDKNGIPVDIQEVKSGKGTSKKRNRVIFCRVCNLFKPRSTRARFQSCKHIACYDCVRIALHVEFWAAKINSSRPGPKAVCPVCHVPLDWSSIKPYIVLAEEAKYSPVLTLAFSGKDIPSNTQTKSQQRYMKNETVVPDVLSGEISNPQDSITNADQQACERLQKTYKILQSFFPDGVDMDLILSDNCSISETFSGQCINLLLGLNIDKQEGTASNKYVDLLERWRKELTSES